MFCSPMPMPSKKTFAVFIGELSYYLYRRQMGLHTVRSVSVIHFDVASRGMSSFRFRNRIVDPGHGTSSLRRGSRAHLPPYIICTVYDKQTVNNFVLKSIFNSLKGVQHLTVTAFS